MKAEREANPLADCRRLSDAARANPARLIICEQSGVWAIALRRELSKHKDFFSHWPMDETRSIDECWGRLAAAPASFPVVELTPVNIERLLDRMIDMPWRFPLARLAAVVRGGAASRRWITAVEPLIRQAGAIFFATSPRSAAPHGVRALAGAARRHLHDAPRPPLTISEEIWARLPWSR